MQLKKTLKEIILKNQDRDFSNIQKRDVEVPINTGKIISVTGIRRCGKTHLLFLAIKELINSGTKRHKIVFINFEDERLNFSSDNLDLIIQAYRELFPAQKLGEVYFFFDEVQNVENWEKFVRRIYDNETQNLYVTGSNSKMLSSDISTSLRGRNINIELFPLSFKEYLSFKNVDANYYDATNKAKIINELSTYLNVGGFPETINSNFAQKILQDYYYVMLYKDIIERYDVKNIPAIKYFLNRIVLNISKPSSINKIYNELKSGGYKISKDSLYLFAEYSEAIYLSFKLPKFDYSYIKQEKSEKKIYLIDNGLLNSLTYHFSENKGILLENAVYLYLRQKHGNNLFFYKDKTECDFIIRDKDKITELIQVSYQIEDKDTLKREIRGIENAAEYFNLKEGKIITFDTDKDTVLTENGVEIQIVSAFRYLLKN